MAKKDNSAQSQRFVETARKICADESEDRFEYAIDRVVAQRKQVKP